ncbi:MAG TPA: phosphoribosyl-ATP diphosphatase [Anaerovoracaceae bacterium]|nr:phosphoribosyl-ATP diphosphatase [Anaerovoracaceae bacterium]
MNETLNELYNVIINRRDEPMEGSYTCYLLNEGLNKILKKCGEECSEVIIAAKDGDVDEIKSEVCDLVFHLLVLLVDREIKLNEIEEILQRRSEKIGNLKTFYKSDHSS